MLEIAECIAGVLNKQRLKPKTTGKYRVGDIRHCFADIGLARSLIGYYPAMDLQDGISDLAEWLKGRMADDRVENASAELDVRGLTI